MVKVGLALLCVLIGAGLGYEEELEPSSVVVLTDDNFEDTLKEHEFVLVKFYAPWCSHCKRLAPEYEKAAEALQEAGSKAVIANLDATEEPLTAEKYKIASYPTLLLFRSGQQVDKYSGGRTSEAIVTYILQKTGESPKPDL